VNSAPNAFDQQMEWVQQYFTPVGIDELVRFTEGQPLPRNPILISFDDGYRDSYATALPILKRRGIKAVFFIATSYITERRMFWWDRVNFLIKSSTRRHLDLSYPFPMRFDTSDEDGRRSAIRSILRIIKTARGLDLPRLLGELQTTADSPWTDDLERSLAAEHLMTWDEVRGLRAAGMDVQSHTRTHRVLQTLEDRQILDELRGSREDLERELGEPISAISYPVGYNIDNRGYIREALAQSGYKIAFTNGSGVHWIRNELDRFQVKRMCVGSGTPDAVFRAMLAFPPLFE
jgi:peptidoglycan/xylan/chitin deacetylase (PgdA/CDA1 family)